MSEAVRQEVDIAVIGGGFYGCTLALYLGRTTASIRVLEAEDQLLGGASAINQARIHNGYHYPRSLLTAYRSAQNYQRFKQEYADCIYEAFDHYYAIARHGSKVNRSQFERIIRQIQVPLYPAPAEVVQLFDADRIEAVFRVEECAFDATRLRNTLTRQLEAARIPVSLNTPVRRITQAPDGRLVLTLDNETTVLARKVFHCTYAGINPLLQQSGLALLPIKQELSELALISVPDLLKNKGVTVMDGPFFSMMPFPAEHCHSLSHVRYTPHRYWLHTESVEDAAGWLRDNPPRSNFPYMVKDAARYLPVLSEAVYRDSRYAFKAILQRNETDDGRPILLNSHYDCPDLVTILGGKLDNIYDILGRLQDQTPAPGVVQPESVG